MKILKISWFITFLFIFMFHPIQLYSQNNPIKRKILTWDFFKNNKDLTDQYDSIVFGKLLCNFKVVKVSGEKISLLFDVIVLLDTTKSYVNFKMKGKDLGLLNHEQGHVDIASLYANKLKATLSSTSFLIKTYKNLIGEIYNRNNIFFEKEQKQYDIETDHGRNKAKQAEWDEYFKKELNIK